MDLRYLIDVRVKPSYQGQQEGDYAFAYSVEIENQGSFTARLISRHWLITDGNGNTEEVKGPGVVGEHPIIVPGDCFRYTSGALLKTPVGSMRGQYEMEADDGHRFMAQIRPFTLAVHGSLN